MRLLVTSSVLVLLASAILSQDEDKEKTKKEILEKLKEYITQQEKGLLEKVGKIVEDEISKAQGTAPKQDKPKQDKPAAGKGFGYLGVQARPLEEEEAAELGIEGGLRVTSVMEGSPAEKAKIQNEDIIVGIDGKKIEGVEGLVKTIREKGPGAAVKLEIIRDEEKKTVSMTLGKHPDAKTEEKTEEKKEKKEGKQLSQEDLKKKMKDFMEGEEKKADQAKKPEKKKETEPQEEEAPGLDLNSLFDNEQFQQMVENLRPLFESMGMNFDDYFDKDKDGKYHPTENFKGMLENYKDLFKNFQMPGTGEEEQPKEEKQPEKKKEETKPKEEKKTGKPFMGIQVEDLTEDERADHDLEAGVGLKVKQVRKDSPAEKAGLKVGDIVIEIDGKSVKGKDFVVKFVEKAKPDQKAKVKIIRGDSEKTVEVKIGERSE